MTISCPCSKSDRASSRQSYYFFKIIRILSSHLLLSVPGDLFTSDLPTKALPQFLFFRMHSTCPAHHFLLDFITRRTVQIMKLLTMQFSPFSCYFLPLGPSIFLSTSFDTARRAGVQAHLTTFNDVVPPTNVAFRQFDRQIFVQNVALSAVMQPRDQEERPTEPPSYSYHNMTESSIICTVRWTAIDTIAIKLTVLSPCLTLNAVFITKPFT